MVILGLGSNKGDRGAFLRAAVVLLAGVLTNLRASPVYESQALLPKNARSEWDRLFLNMAVCGDTSLAPEALLMEVKAMERHLGRRPAMAWSPREIDIDILAMDATVLRTASLSIPHQELLNRDFALLPLVDLAPDWRYPAPGPDFGRRAADIAAARRFTCGRSLWKINMDVHA